MSDPALQSAPLFDNLEVVKTGVATIAAFTESVSIGETKSVTVAHNLGYVPIVIAFRTINGINYGYHDNNGYIYQIAGGISGLGQYFYNMTVDYTNVTFNFNIVKWGIVGNAGWASQDITYYLLRIRGK